MENHQRIGRAQPSFSNPATNLSQQQSLPPAKLSSSTNSASSANFQGSHKGTAHHHSDVHRSRTRGAKGYSGDRFRGNGNHKFACHDNGGAGYQRRSASYQQGNEVRRYGQKVGNGHTAEKVSRHGESASHLLNFTYAPVRSQDEQGNRRSLGARRGKAKRQDIHTKEQFLQAHCQFVVKEPVTDADYVHCLADTDVMVSWEDIEQVIVRDEHLSSCPICMEVPVAAKITKCAHVYCWHCILQYLSNSDKAWSRCPICFDSVEEKDLKSVVTTAVSKPKVGDEITLYLMKRERGSLYVRPTSLWRSSDAGRLFNPLDDQVDVRYSKLLTATSHYLHGILTEERRQLLDLLNREDTLSLEASFVQAALDSLSARVKSTGRLAPSLSEMKASAVQETEAVAPIVPSIKSAPNLRAVSYSDAFEEVSSPSEQGSDDSLPPVVVTSSPADAVREESCSSDSSDLLLSTKPADVSRARVRTVSSASSSDGVEVEQIAAHLVLPPTGTQPGHASGSKRTEVYYFYQAADGQHIYLHSINTRLLAAQYGSLEMAPAVLTATIVETEDNSITLDLRKRLKYLSHLPLYCQFSVCEVVLRPPIVSSQCLAHFSEELNQRKRMRNRRLRTETRQDNRAQAEERRRMGQYPDMSLPLDSDRHFPSSSVTDTPPSLAEFAPLIDTPPLQDVTSEHSVPSRQHEVPLTTPYSFSQAMKGSSDPAAAWPRAQPSYARSSACSVQRVGEVEAEEGSAPSFQESFSAGFTLQDMSKLSVADGDTQNSKSGKKGRNKKKKTQVLFTTSSHRGNH